MLTLPRVSRPDVPVAVSAVALLAIGTTLALAGLGASSVPLVVAGGGLAAATLVVLITGGWVDGLAVLAIALPWPAIYSTERVRISAAVAVTATVLVGWLLGRAVDRRRIALGAVPIRSALGLLAAVAFAALFAHHRLIAARELVNFVLFIGLLAAATAALTAEPRNIRSLALLLAGVVGVCGALAALEAVGIVPGRFPLRGTPFNRAALGFGWPNELAMFLAVGLPLSVYAVEAARTMGLRLLALLALAGGIAGLAATFSRGSWLAVLGATLVLPLAGERRFALRVWVAALAAVLVLDVVSGGALRQRAAGTVDDWVVQQRVALTVVGLLMFREEPLVGVGPGAFGEELERFGPQVAGLWDYTGSAHNGYVHMAAETGVIGFTALVVFFGSVLFRLLRDVRRAGRPGAGDDRARLRRAALWSFGTACAVGLVEWPFAHGVAQLIMLAAAMGLALYEPGSAAPAEPEPSVGPAA